MKLLAYEQCCLPQLESWLFRRTKWSQRWLSIQISVLLSSWAVIPCPCSLLSSQHHLTSLLLLLGASCIISPKYQVSTSSKPAMLS